MARTAWANAAWWAACTPAYAGFRRALGRPAAVQRELLARCLGTNADTVYGRRHGFAGIRSVREYQQRVPLCTFDDLESLVERVAAGEPGVLTRDPVRLLEPTGGSGGPAKRIPYTRTLQAEISRAVGPWIFDLYRSDPALVGGPAYWSITPAARPQEESRSRVPEGFADDCEYLGGWAGRLAGAVMAAPSELRHLTDIATFRYVTMVLLLRCRELRLISVWHPSFLSLLLEDLETHWEDWLRDLTDGRLRPPGGFPDRIGPVLQSRFRSAPGRARELAAAGPGDLARVWPRLRLVSCWADGNAAGPARALGDLLPGVRIQPKGLLATEAVVTIPFAGAHLPALRSHFFEFLAADGRARLLHELEPREEYEVVVTTGGGLFRYRLEDRVRVTGCRGETPILRFLGKLGHVSDRFGEKLTEAFATAVIGKVTRAMTVRFALLAPEVFGAATAYVLYLEAEEAGSPDLGAEVEAELGRNPQYRYCVQLGQLSPARVFRIEAGGQEAFLQRCRAGGARLGDVKPLGLSREDGWSRVFNGRWTAAPKRFTSGGGGRMALPARDAAP